MSRDGVSPASEPAPAGRDPERTRRQILDAARAAFARHGLAGARVNDIAEAARANKRMIYYYFTDKEGLFLATLERVYAELSAAGSALDLDLAPDAALARFVDFVWDYYRAHPEAIALLNDENLHGGRHLRRSARIRGMERPLMDKLARLLERGAACGAFRRDLDPVSVHITLIALVYLYIGNSATLSIYFDRDLAGEPEMAGWRTHIQSTLRAITAP